MTHCGDQECDAGRVLVGDLAPQHLGEDVGDLIVVQRLAAGQVVRAAIMPILTQHLGRHRADVARVDEAGLGAAHRQIDLVTLADLSPMGRVEVLHEKAGAQECIGHAGALDVLLGRVVRHPRVALDAQQRDEDDVPNAGLDGEVNERVECVLHVGDLRWAHQKETFDPVHRWPVGFRICEVEVHGFHAR